jgi:8-amino-7-oxononanoate synthase
MVDVATEVRVATVQPLYYLIERTMSASTIQDELLAIKNQSLYRRLRRVENDQGPILMLDGRQVINLSSNNYLGLANHPALAAAAKEAIDRYGCGSGASRLISGNMALHEELEFRLARFKGTEAALVFNSGFQLNTGILSTLAGEGDVIFSDALNHASIIDGCRLSRGQTVVYPHGDLNRLEAALRQSVNSQRRLIVTESIFSMDGDEAPLTQIVELAERHDAMVMVDEAHATGLFGANGAGVVAKLGLSDRVAVQMGTLGKALGGFGAYVAGSRALRELLINRCRSFIFTTALPPAVMAMAIAAVDLVEREPERRAVLWDNCRHLSEGLRSLGFDTRPPASAILPLIIGDAGACMKLSEQLLERGIFAQGIRPPTVPPGTSRLRITVMATHGREHLDAALNAFRSVKEC